MEIRYTHDTAFRESFRGEMIYLPRGFSGWVSASVGSMLIARGLAVEVGACVAAPAPAVQPSAVKRESRFAAKDPDDE